MSSNQTATNFTHSLNRLRHGGTSDSNVGTTAKSSSSTSHSFQPAAVVPAKRNATATTTTSTVSSVVRPSTATVTKNMATSTAKSISKNNGSFVASRVLSDETNTSSPITSRNRPTNSNNNTPANKRMALATPQTSSNHQRSSSSTSIRISAAAAAAANTSRGLPSTPASSISSPSVTNQTVRPNVPSSLNQSFSANSSRGDDWKNRLTTMSEGELTERFNIIMADMNLIYQERMRRQNDPQQWPQQQQPSPPELNNLNTPTNNNYQQHNSSNNHIHNTKDSTVNEVIDDQDNSSDYFGDDLDADLVFLENNIENSNNHQSNDMDTSTLSKTAPDDADTDYGSDDDINNNEGNNNNNNNNNSNKNNTDNDFTIIDGDNYTSFYNEDTILFQDPHAFEDENEKHLNPTDDQLWHPWSRDVFKTLNQRFQMTSFRRHQLEVINDCLAGKDVFVLMPTGGGKSLCFQVPALISSGRTRGLTVVVSPLLSLIDDQVQNLRNRGICALKLVGKMPAEETRFVYDEFRYMSFNKQSLSLLYTTPESLSLNKRLRDALKGLYEKNLLARFAIDEAHCISDWGHDFRPDYKELKCLKQEFPRVPIIALTATANRRVQNDVIQNLQMSIKEPFLQSFNRPNLTYEVRTKTKNVVQSMATAIQSEFNNMSGIIYCLSKRDCENVAQELRDNYNIPASHYHAGLGKDERSNVQRKWLDGTFLVICATIAFGMGIDKRDVRFVIHHSMPKSLEGYYQETGRAGRDGKRSKCILYFNWSDRIRAKTLMERNTDNEPVTPEQLERRMDNLERVVSYCLNEVDCRRQQVLAYFDENFPKSKCQGTCDNCSKNVQVENKDYSHQAIDILNLVKYVQTTKNTGPTLSICIDAYRGSQLKKIVDMGLTSIEEHGKGKSLPKTLLERLIQRIITEGGLAEDLKTSPHGATYAYLIKGKKFNDIIQGRKKVHMCVRVDVSKNNQTEEVLFDLEDFGSPPPEENNNQENAFLLSDDDMITPNDNHNNNNNTRQRRNLRQRYAYNN